MNYDPYEGEPRRKSSLLPGCLLGCLASVVVIALIVGVGGWLAYTKGPGMLAQLVREGLVEGLAETDLPEEQQRRIIEQLDRVVEGVKNGKVTVEDFETTAREIVDSPLISLIAVAAIDAKYLSQSGLSEEEKSEAETTIRRVMRGVLDERLEFSDLSEAMEVIAENRGDNEWRLRNKVTDEELRDFVAKCRTVADTAEIEIDPAPVDIADEIRQIVDKLLAE